jgi:hypothetical protein
MVDWMKSQKRIDFDEIREYLYGVLGAENTEHLIKTGSSLEELVSQAVKEEREIDAEIEQQMDDFYLNLDIPEDI